MKKNCKMEYKMLRFLVLRKLSYFFLILLIIICGLQHERNVKNKLEENGNQS